jgi:hypothetical protein
MTDDELDKLDIITEIVDERIDKITGSIKFVAFAILLVVVVLATL